MACQKKLLLIDDDADHLLICQFVLEHRGYDILAQRGIETPSQLFEAVLDFQPDIIFTGQDLTKISGENFIRMLKNVPRFNHIPIIYFSSSQTTESSIHQIGADDFLAKPLKTRDLFEILAKYVS